MQAAEIGIPYGDEEVTFGVDGATLVGVYTPHQTPAAADPDRTIRLALAHPSDGPRLREVARGKRSALILVDDNTRETPVDRLVRALLEELASGGLPADGVRLMIALGTHRAMTDAEIRHKLGDEVLSSVQVLQHEHSVAPLEDLGATRNGTPVLVNRELFKADLVIGTGSVVPHHIPGFSAGAKIVQPGVSGAATTAATHMFSARAPAPLLGRIDSPVRREMEDIAQRSHMHYAERRIMWNSRRAPAIAAGHDRLVS